MIAKAISERLIKREELFVSTKIWPTLYEKAYAVEKTLSHLGLDYVDLQYAAQSLRAGIPSVTETLN